MSKITDIANRNKSVNWEDLQDPMGMILQKLSTGKDTKENLSNFRLVCKAWRKIFTQTTVKHNLTLSEKKALICKDTSVNKILPKLRKLTLNFKDQNGDFPNWPDSLKLLENLQEITFRRLKGKHVEQLKSLKSFLSSNQIKSISIEIKKADSSALELFGQLRKLKTVILRDFSFTKDCNLEDLRGLTHLNSLMLNFANNNFADLSPLKEVPLKDLFIYTSDFTKDQIQQLAGISSIEDLALCLDGNVTENSFGQLSTLRNLKKLHLPRLILSRSDLTQWKTLQQLTSLNLSHCKSNDQLAFGQLGLLSNLQSLNVDFTNIKDSDIRQWTSLNKLQTLNLSGCEECTGACFRTINQFTALTNLNLSNLYVDTSVDFGLLKSLWQLHELNLNYTQVNSEDLENLQQLPNLKNLWLWSCQNLTQQSVAILAQFPKLEVLHFSYCKNIPAGSYVPLSQLSNLKFLGVDSSQINDEDLTALQRLQHLEDLDLRNCKNVTTQSLEILAQFPKLGSLQLDDCSGILPGSFCKLSKLESLKHLNVVNCSINDDDVAFFHSWKSLISLSIGDCGILSTTSIELLKSMQNVTFYSGFDRMLHRLEREKSAQSAAFEQSGQSKSGHLKRAIREFFRDLAQAFSEFSYFVLSRIKNLFMKILNPF